MKLPNTVIVPQWILDLVAVADEEFRVPESMDNAKARFRDFIISIQNPDVLHVLASIACKALEIPAEMMALRFEGMHDIMNQQQQIGEQRGLQAIFKGFEEVHSVLRQSAQGLSDAIVDQP